MNKFNKVIKPIKHKEISKYPVITKDVSFIINDNITYYKKLLLLFLISLY